jgi:hypothetical protein
MTGEEAARFEARKYELELTDEQMVILASLRATCAEFSLGRKRVLTYRRNACNHQEFISVRPKDGRRCVLQERLRLDDEWVGVHCNPEHSLAVLSGCQPECSHVWLARRVQRARAFLERVFSGPSA